MMKQAKALFLLRKDKQST